MKRKERFLVLFALLLSVSSALAQIADSQPSADSQTSNDLPHPVAVARCAYTQADDVCASAHPDSQGVTSPSDDTTLAQIPRRAPGPPFRGGRPPMGGPAYPAMWQSAPSAGHALIGALIGAGIGVAVGVRGNAGARATLGLATVSAGLGAAIGLSIPSLPSRNPYWRRWPQDDDDEEARQSRPHKSKFALSKPASPHATSPSPSPIHVEDGLSAAGAP
jgi:hypothetical protein